MQKLYAYICVLIFCILLSISPFFTTYAQQQPIPPCGIDLIQAKQLATDSAYRAFRERVKASNNKVIVDTTTPITIPVVFVVYHLGEPVGAGSNVSEADLQNQIGLMNKMFAGTRPMYGGVDTRIRFTLARRTTSCTPFNGIARVDARSVANYQSSGVNSGNWQMVNQLRALVPDYNNSIADRFVVVRVVHQVSGATAWANYGGDIVIGASTLQSVSTYNSTLTHEMGHVLFLNHTFNGYSYNSTTNQYGCPTNTEPENDGDQVADTDPHKIWEPSNSCSSSSELEINACTGRPFGLIGRNYMSYSCNLMMFTAGQRQRMRSYLAEGLRGLATSVYATAPDASQEMIPTVCSLSVVSTSASGGEGISDVQFQGIRKMSNSWTPANGHYQDYTCQERTTVTAGQSYSLTVRGYGTYQKAYIDYNNDGAFDEATEVVWNAGSSGSGMITIPTTAVMDRYLRMRVVIDNGPAPPTACYLPGSQYGSGEVEDYAVRILPADTPPSVAIGPLTSPYLCRGQQLSVPLVTLGTFPADNTFYVQLSDANGSFDNPVLVGSGTHSPVSVTLPALSTVSEEYRLRVIATNPSLTSETSPMLAIENPASVSIIPGSATLASGQSTSFTVALTGRLPIDFTIYQNNYSRWTFGGFQHRTYVHQFTATGSAVYSISNVRNSCGVGYGSSLFTVTTPCAAPGSLTESQQTSNGFQANWNMGSGASVMLQWKESGAAAWNQQTLQNYSNWFISGLIYGKTYVWRVKSVCIDGESDWSAERTITLSCPTPFSLSELLGPTAARLRWSYLGSGTTYTVQWRPVGITSWNTASGLNSSYHELSGLINGGSYEWRVRTQCTDGAVTDYSPTRTFTTQCGPTEGGGYSINSTTDITVFWTALPGGRYQVRYRPVNSPTWIGSDSTTGLGSVRFKNLAMNTSYEYQVRTVCSETAVSAYSPAYSFDTQCYLPSVYLSTISLTSAQITWSTLTGQRYELRWRAVGTPNWTNVQSLTTAPYRINGLTTGTTYEVQVRGVCSETVASSYSNSLTFTPSCPVPINNSMWVSRVGPTMAQVVFNVESGTTYTVQWRPAGDTTWPPSATFTASYTTNQYVYLISNLTKDVDYQWRVQSFCSNEVSGVSSVGQFRTACSTPFGYSSEPTSTSILVFVYDSSDTPFQVRWRPLGSATWTEGASTTAITYPIKGLVTNVTYEWQIRTICSTNSATPYSSSYQFTTRCSTPLSYNLRVTNLLPKSALLNWPANEVQTNLRWRAAGNPDWTVVTSLTTNSYSLTGLTSGTTYEWQVQSVCSSTASSSYVSGTSFTPICVSATSLTEGFLTSRYTQFRWNAIAGQAYRVEWRVQGETSWPNSQTVTSTYSGTFYTNTISGLTPGSTYEWRVMTLCDGTMTASASRTFVAQCTVPGGLYVNNVTARTANVGWTGPYNLPGVVYQFRWRPVGTSTWSESSTLISSYASLTGLTINTNYEWQVRMICDGAQTDYSPNGPTFTTRCPTPSLYSVSVTDIGARLSFVYFAGEPQTIRYRIAGQTVWTSIENVTTGIYNLTGLTPSTAYEWQVLITCSDGQTNATSVGQFATTASCDSNEPNNTVQTATALPSDVTSYTSVDLCLNLTTDNDWYRWDYRGQAFYILVYPFAYGTTGLYKLRLELTGNSLKINTLPGSTFASSPTDTYLRLYAGNGTTLLAENDDSNGTVYSEVTYTLPANCTAMTTVKAGLWTDPTVWSCGRVPTSVDAVQVLHAVSVPVNHTGRAWRVTYGAGGSVMMEPGGRLVMGQ